MNRAVALPRLLRIPPLPRLPYLTLCFLVLVIAASLVPGAAALLELDRAALERGQLWRLVTGGLTHSSPSHLLVDLLVFLGLALLLERRGRRALAVPLVLGLVLVPAAVLLCEPARAVYRGLSGVDSALFCCLGALLFCEESALGRPLARVLALLALVLFLARTLAEWSSGTALFAGAGPDFRPPPMAHLAGAAAGLSAALALRFDSRRSNHNPGAVGPMRSVVTNTAAALVLLAATASAAFAGEDKVHRSVPLGDVEITAGELPDWTRPFFDGAFQRGGRGAVLAPRVALDGPGSAYVLDPGSADSVTPSTAGLRLCVKTADAAAVTGRIALATGDGLEFAAARFRLPELDAAAAATPGTAHDDFLRAEQAHHRRLARSGIPGAAWFRHQAGMDLGPGAALPDFESELERSFALFTGARALAENLQLERTLDPAVGAREEERVAVATIEGIGVRAYDWSSRVAGLEPALDPLARFLPADQHAIFFPSFADLLAVIDETDRAGTPLARLFEGEAVSAGTRRRYERQLLLPLDDLTRTLGPHLVRSLAVTGSDPYLRSGSDVAVLLEARDADALWSLLAAARAASGTDETRGEVAGVAYEGVRSPDRSICSYAARAEDAVLVTNSLVQVATFGAVKSGARPALAALDEYRFFRDRYPLARDGAAAARGTVHGTALVVLTDATIRRWCGPRTRIGASRRVRATARLLEEAALAAEHAARGMAEPAVDPALHAAYGDLSFVTPIAELDLDHVSRAEADAYVRYRDRYQQQWRRFFDPIALAVTVTGDGFESDLSVLPLIADSDLRQYLDISRGVSLDATAGDPHPGTILHFVQALNLNAPSLREANDFFEGLLAGTQTHPFAWVGDSVALYVEDDPLFDELAALGEDTDLEQFLEENLARLPIAFTVEVKDALGLAAFLTAVRGLAHQAAPGVVTFESREHGEHSYVRVVEAAGMSTRGEPMAIYYAITPGRLVITPCQAVLERAIDRGFAASAEPGPNPWLGESLALDLNAKILRFLEAVLGEWHEEDVRVASWQNLIILDEWKRLFPDQDPVAVHERIFHQRLVCPAGGEYVWNAQDRRMESSVLGHPEAPRGGRVRSPLIDLLSAAACGVTFEDDGLRARVRVRR